MRRERKRSSRGSNSPNLEDTSPLTTLQDGEKGIVAHVSGGFGLVRRLCDMGITPGTKIKVLNRCAFHGPLQIKVRDVSLALGYGVASRIYVRKRKKGKING